MCLNYVIVIIVVLIFFGCNTMKNNINIYCNNSYC